jgi:hypothetical protein
MRKFYQLLCDLLLLLGIGICLFALAYIAFHFSP